MPPDTVIAADEQARAAARLRGAAEALGVLQGRGPADQARASRLAMELLRTDVSATPADWTRAGLPGAGPDFRQEPGQRDGYPVPAGHPAVVRLARSAMALYCSRLRVADRPGHWARLAEYFAGRLGTADPELVRLRERAATARVAAGDTSPEVFEELLAALDFHRTADGEDGYLTTLARANLSIAYRQRRAGSDLARSTVLAEEEVAARTARYGAGHPVTLVARSLLTLSLLLQAEAGDEETARRRLASRALAEITDVRAARDRLYGVTSPTAAQSRRYEARALILLGQPGKARDYLEYTLAFENAHCAGEQTQSIGQTHYQLARVYRQLGEAGKALGHAQRAHRIFTRHNPGSSAAREAARLAGELSPGRR